MSAITLVEYAKNAPTPVSAAVRSTFARASALLASIPLETVAGPGYAYNLEAALPGTAFRGVNEAYAPSSGVINPAFEAYKIAGGDLDTDKAIVKMYGAGRRATDVEMKAKSLAALLSNAIIKGDSSSNPRYFDGLQRRVNTSGSQIVEAGTTDGGDALKLTKIDELISKVAGPNKALIMSRAMKLKFAAAARTSTVGGYVVFQPDAFGRSIPTYNGVPILEEFPELDGTEALAFDEVGGTGSTATATSIYCASLAPGYVWMAQNSPMDVVDLGELDESPVLRTRVEWLVTPVVEHPKAIARLRGVSNAAIVA
jgi:hypothetical protein